LLGDPSGAGSPYKFDLEDRTIRFAQEVRKNSKVLLDSPVSSADVRQLLRSSGSVGANYFEANEAVSKRDFIHRLKIARKEAKETGYWLQILMDLNPEHQESLAILLQESKELRNILTAIINKQKSSE